VNEEDIEYLHQEVHSAIEEMRDMYEHLDNRMQKRVTELVAKGTQLSNVLSEMWKKASEEEQEAIEDLYEEFAADVLRMKEQLKTHTNKPTRH
jgi:gas vesicle protein